MIMKTIPAGQLMATIDVFSDEMNDYSQVSEYEKYEWIKFLAFMKHTIENNRSFIVANFKMWTHETIGRDVCKVTNVLFKPLEY